MLFCQIEFKIKANGNSLSNSFLKYTLKKNRRKNTRTRLVLLQAFSEGTSRIKDIWIYTIAGTVRRKKEGGGSKRIRDKTT